jgi:hypothetical protein
MKPSILATVRIGFLVLVGLLAGCKTTDTAQDGSLASVIITGHTEKQVQQTTIEVFRWNGFNQLSGLTFEKKGSKWDTLSYGSLDSKAVWIKMRVSITPMTEDRQVLSCDAYIVDNHGEGFMESERKLDFGKADECKKILDQIKRRLSVPPPKSS